MTYLCKNHGERDDESLVDARVDANTIRQQIEQQIEQSRCTFNLSNGRAVAGDGALMKKRPETTK